MFNNEKLVRLSQESGRENKDRVLKLTEEVGEVAQAYLSADGSKGSEYKKHTFDDVKEELVDVMIVAFSLFVKLGTEQEFNELMEIKLNKWERVNK